MLQNAYFLAKIGADTAENEQHFAENLPKVGCGANVIAPAATAAPDPNACKEHTGKSRHGDDCKDLSCYELQVRTSLFFLKDVNLGV